MWGPRQTGKTWIMRRAIEEIRARYGDRFVVGKMSMQGVILNESAPTDEFLKRVPRLFRLALEMDVEQPADWDDLGRLFERSAGVFGNKRLILLIDEFDKLRPDIIDRIVSLFRDMYLAREGYVLHGLVLIGVRAVLGLDSVRGSPFNVQRSLHIPNLTRDEVVDMFAQYQAESGQTIESAVVEGIYTATRGQPGLVSWFGELLTEKYNLSKEKAITLSNWKNVYQRGLHSEWNNTFLNLIKKAQGEHRPQVLRLFTDPNVPFTIRDDGCNFLFMNGIIDESIIPDPANAEGSLSVCRFSSPFVQESLFAAFSTDMFGDKGPILPFEFGDTLADVFTPEGLHIPRLLQRYRGYLKRLKAKGIDPWLGQPRRQDLQYTEAVGHFHLYAWLKDAIGRRCLISPEFPTGNGKVDLLLRTKDHTAIVEIKSLRDISELENHRAQVAVYAKKLQLSQATLVVFAPVDDESVLEPLVSDIDVDGVLVSTVPFGWV
jgi:hypothetical protein